ncbi:AraC family transcriptional regulator [Sciscionella marina]|uniref:AraC family transcriptional regulator n=1 Tax=Sciscionella marina TaxID=508770 RepID=UPI00035D7F36|nr:helix-turn-helix transcriptional regulator [Sciscionella marina]
MSENGQASLVTTAHRHVAGEVIERHAHPFHQLIYVSSGVLAVRTDATAWVASRSRAMWVPAQTPHQHRVHGSSLVYTIGFASADAPLPTAAPAIVSVGPLLRELLIAGSAPELPEDERERIRAVLCDRLRHSALQPLLLPVPCDRRLARACELVTEDLARPRGIAWLARRSGVSERTLTRLFRTEFGLTYPQWRTSVRIFHAMIGLAEGATVTEAGQRCGWATTSAFVDVFTRTLGQTPGKYRSAVTGERG